MNSSRLTRSAVLLAALLLAAGCGDSSTAQSGATTAKASTTTVALANGSTITTKAATTPTTTAASVASKPLPAPCSLITKDEVAAALGTTVGDGVATPTNSFGVTQCAYSPATGVQAKNVLLKTRADYAKDASYVFPSAASGKVSGIGDTAFVDLHEGDKSGTITVKLGANAIEIAVNGYDRAVDSTTLQTLARAAVGRA